MSRAPRSHFAFRDVVIVADVFTISDSIVPFEFRHDLERTEASTLAALIEAIEELGLRTHHYHNPHELSDNANRHRNDIVWSIYGGETSRNRMALVPAACEIHGLKFLGPDVYGRIICQDKEISKRLAMDSGLQTPRHRLLRSERDLSTIRTFPLPLVVKPALEGSSIGITQRNLIKDVKTGLIVARELLRNFEVPILVEEFVGGREVSYCVIQAEPRNHWSLAEVAVADQPNYFNDHLFDAEEKQFRRLPRDVQTIDALLPSIDKAALDYLLATLGTFSYARVDGKLQNGRFVFLEITPDAWIAPLGSMAKGFTNKGWTYSDFIAAVLSSVVTTPRNPLPNGSKTADGNRA